MRISDWSSDVCSSDLTDLAAERAGLPRIEMAATALPVVAALAAFIAPLSQATQDVHDTPPPAGVPLPAASVPEPAMEAPVYGPPAATAAPLAAGEDRPSVDAEKSVAVRGYHDG